MFFYYIINTLHTGNPFNDDIQAFDPDPLANTNNYKTFLQDLLKIKKYLHISRKLENMHSNSETDSNY